MNIYVYYMQPRCVCVWGGGGGGPQWQCMFHARYVPASMSQVPAFISQNIGLRPIQIGYTTITLFIS